MNEPTTNDRPDASPPVHDPDWIKTDTIELQVNDLGEIRLAIAGEEYYWLLGRTAAMQLRDQLERALAFTPKWVR